MNVILLTIDALRYDKVDIYNHNCKVQLTPFLDSIADRCIIFNNAYSTGPYTQVSFPGILTSSYYFDFGRSPFLSPKRTLISEVLRKNGILTAAFHSNPYLSEYFGWNRGWDNFYDSMQEEVSEKRPYIPGHDINKKVEEWLVNKVKGEKNKPFFLWVHYMDVHEPYIPKSEYLSIIHPELVINEDEMFNLYKEVLLKRDVSDMEKLLLLEKLYEGKVREVDDYVKELFTILSELEILEDSRIIIMSDHGDEFGEHGGLSHDGKMYQELLHIPLLFYDPSRRGREIFNKAVSAIDIAPTILYLFELGTVENFKGRPLFPLDEYKERECYAEAIEKHGTKIKETDKEVYCLIANGLKIIYHSSNGSWEMYNLNEDPHEKNNIATKSPKFEEMKNMLISRINRQSNKS